MRVIRTSDLGIEHAAHEAAIVLATGGIVLYPTDTLYGLGVNALDRGAIERLQALKGREKGKPISVVVPEVAAIAKYGELSEEARTLAERFLPGALTLVVPGTPLLPRELMQDGAIGMRIPDDPFCLSLAHTFKAPFTATSANRAGMPTPSTVPEILTQFGERMGAIDLIIDDGPRAGGVPSTVVSFASGTPVILREGALSAADLNL